MLTHPSSKRAGSILLLSVITIMILSALAVASLTLVKKRYHLAFQTASWQEALPSAEAGVEVAVEEIRKTLYDSTNAFKTRGWTQPDATKSLWTYENTLSARATDGGTDSSYKVTVDVPFVDPRNQEPYYRIRSIGMMEIPGAQVVNGNRIDNNLRKLSLWRDRKVINSDPAQPTLDRASTSGVKYRPHAARLIEAVVRPVGPFRMALFSVKKTDMTDHNIVVDSYDSRDAAKSTYDPAYPNVPGQYDPAEAQAHGDIGTDGPLINAGSAHIRGDAGTHDGSITKSDNIEGQIVDDFWQEILPVKMPVVDPLYYTRYTTVSSSLEIQAEPADPAKPYEGVTEVKVDTVSLQGNGSKTITIKGRTDANGNPIPTYCQIMVTGNFNLSGSGTLVLEKGVYVRIFVGGDVKISGNGAVNPNSPLNLQIYGVDANHIATDANGNPMYNPDGTPVVASPGTITIDGNGAFKGAVYAPTYDISMKGGGTTDSVFGSFSGYSIKMTGTTSIHYDEALADGGPISDYKIISWFEDTR